MQNLSYYSQISIEIFTNFHFIVMVNFKLIWMPWKYKCVNVKVWLDLSKSKANKKLSYTILFAGCMTLQEAQNMTHDYSTKLIITEVGRGMWRHQLCRRKYPMDYTFRMHQDFMVEHPVLKEEIKVNTDLLLQFNHYYSQIDMTLWFQANSNLIEKHYNK